MNFISQAVSNLMDRGGDTMTTSTARARGRIISKERRAELEKKGSLHLDEAAELLNMAPKTLYNRMSGSRKDPDISAPKGRKGRRGWVFDVNELKAWDRQN